MASSAPLMPSRTQPANPGRYGEQRGEKHCCQGDFGGVQGAEDEPADAQAEGQGDPGGAELQGGFQEGDGQHHAEPGERGARADDLPGCGHRSGPGRGGRRRGHGWRVGGQVGQAEVWFDERHQPHRGGWVAELGERALQEPEVDGADDVGVFPGDVPVGAGAEPDFPFPGVRCGVGEFGVEVHLGEQVDDPVGRFVRGGDVVGGGDEGGCPVPAGLFGAAAAGAGGGAEVSGENGGEGPVPVGRGLLGAGGVDGAGSSGGGPRGFLHGDLSGSGEHVQVESDGGDVQPGRLGELVDVQGGVAAAEQLEQPPAGFGRGGVGRCVVERARLVGHVLSGGWAATSSVSTPSRPILVAPPGDATGWSRPGSGSVKNRALSSVNAAHWFGTSSS